MNRRPLPLVKILLGVFLVTAGMGVWFRSGKIVQKSQSSAIQLISSNTNASPIIEKVSQGITHVPPVQADLQKIATSLTNSLDDNAARQLQAEFRCRLAAMPTNMAATAIKQMLESKEDGPTHLGFKIARNGLLDEAPTFRALLLDELARLDPAAAAEYAKSILANMDSADECAVALRNLARCDSSPAARKLLEEKTRELLQHEQWQGDPSVGYLEAFDVVVFLGGTNLLATLSELVRRHNDLAVAHAAYLALDRMIINDPAAILSVLQADSSLMEGREITRANYFARADVRDSRQREVLENYLLSPHIALAELDAFAGRYPSANFMISNNLLTISVTPDNLALASRDTESLHVLEDWLADPRFADLRPQLGKIKMRLTEFRPQTAAGR
jgi:hypothetical protein